MIKRVTLTLATAAACLVFSPAADASVTYDYVATFGLSFSAVSPTAITSLTTIKPATCSVVGINLDTCSVLFAPYGSTPVEFDGIPVPNNLFPDPGTIGLAIDSGEGESDFREFPIADLAANGIYVGSLGTMAVSGIQVSAVPEPSMWELLIVGFGLAGIALRRRHKAGPKASYAA